LRFAALRESWGRSGLQKPLFAWNRDLIPIGESIFLGKGRSRNFPAGEMLSRMNREFYASIFSYFLQVKALSWVPKIFLSINTIP
jgi:hypothetical protein